MSSPKKYSPSKPQLRASERRSVAADLDSFPHEDKMELLRRTSGIEDDDIQEFQQTEILRKSIADVRNRASKHDEARNSPQKYRQVKSKIAGNMKSQKVAKKRGTYVPETKEELMARIPRSTIQYESENQNQRASQIDEHSAALNNLDEEMRTMRERARVNANSISPSKNQNQQRQSTQTNVRVTSSSYQQQQSTDQVISSSPAQQNDFADLRKREDEAAIKIQSSFREKKQVQQTKKEDAAAITIQRQYKKQVTLKKESEAREFEAQFTPDDQQKRQEAAATIQKQFRDKSQPREEEIAVQARVQVQAQAQIEIQTEIPEKVDDRLERIEAMRNQLAAIDRKVFTELKVLNNPPMAVKATTDAFLVILGYSGEDLSWKNFVKLTNNPKVFVNELTKLDPCSFSKKQCKQLRVYTQDNDFSPESVCNKSYAASALCRWIFQFTRMIEVYHGFDQVQQETPIQQTIEQSPVVMKKKVKKSKRQAVMAEAPDIQDSQIFDQRQTNQPQVDDDIMVQLERANARINSIKRADITELKSLNAPPQNVKQTLDAVLLLFGQEQSWISAKKFMSNPASFLSQLVNFDKDHLSLKVWKQLRDQFMRDPDFTEECLMKKSKACAGIFCWISGIFIYSGLAQGQDVKFEHYERQPVQAQLSPRKKRPQTSPTKKRTAKPKQQMAVPQSYKIDIPQTPNGQYKEDQSIDLRTQKELDSATAVQAHTYGTSTYLSKQEQVTIGGNFKERSSKIDQHTADIQSQFDALMQEKNAAKSKGGSVSNDEFFAIMDDYYHNNLPRHESPSKRFIEQKNTTVEHKTMLKENFRQSQDYNLQYFTDPKKSYVMEPHGGEINYKNAMKNPEKFYDQVLSQDIQQTKVRKNKEQSKAHEEKRADERKSGVSPSRVRKIPLEMTSKVTKRKCARVMDVVKAKFGMMMVNRMGMQMNPEMEAAMRKTEVQKHIQDGIESKDIKLVDNKRQTIFRDEMIQIGKKGDLADESPNGLQIDTNELENAELYVSEEQIQKIQQEVENQMNQKDRQTQLQEIHQMIDNSVNQLWQQYDVDKSGVLQKDEARALVQKMMEDMGCPFDESGFDECFKELDENNDGTIQREEMTHFIWQVSGIGKQ